MIKPNRFYEVAVYCEWSLGKTLTYSAWSVFPRSLTLKETLIIRWCACAIQIILCSYVVPETIEFLRPYRWYKVIVGWKMSLESLGFLGFLEMTMHNQFKTVLIDSNMRHVWFSHSISKWFYLSEYRFFFFYFIMSTRILLPLVHLNEIVWNSTENINRWA